MKKNKSNLSKMSYPQFITKHLTLASDLSTREMSSDYSGGEVEFSLTNTTTSKLNISRFIHSLRDNGSMDGGEYGAIGAALTNGINLKYTHNGTVISLTDFPIKENFDWVVECYDTEIVSFSGGNDLLKVRWTFQKSGVGVILDPGERFIMTLHDDFSSVIEMQAVVQGFYFNP